MEQKQPGGIILRRDLTVLAFVDDTAVEIKLSRQEALNFAEALVQTALAGTPPEAILMEREFSIEASAACTH
jgi:hypothetical protein